MSDIFHSRKGLKLMSQLHVDAQFANKYGTEYFNAIPSDSNRATEVKMILDDINIAIQELMKLIQD